MAKRSRQRSDDPLQAPGAEEPFDELEMTGRGDDDAASDQEDDYLEEDVAESEEEWDEQDDDA